MVKLKKRFPNAQSISKVAGNMYHQLTKGTTKLSTQQREATPNKVKPCPKRDLSPGSPDSETNSPDHKRPDFDFSSLSSISSQLDNVYPQLRFWHGHVQPNWKRYISGPPPPPPPYPPTHPRPSTHPHPPTHPTPHQPPTTTATPTPVPPWHVPPQRGCMCSTGSFSIGDWKDISYSSSCYYHHQIGSIHLSHCYHIFPWLCAWDVCFIIFCHLLHIRSGKTGNLFSLLLCSLWWVQIVGYVLPCRSNSFVCTVHHLIIIIVQNYLKTLNL